MNVKKKLTIVLASILTLFALYLALTSGCENGVCEIDTAADNTGQLELREPSIY